VGTPGQILAEPADDDPRYPQKPAHYDEGSQLGVALRRDASAGEEESSDDEERDQPPATEPP